MSQPVFVSGASGQLGRRVVELVLDRGLPVIAGTRSPEKLADLAARGAQIRRIDFTDPASVAAALDGVERALFVSTDAVGARSGPQVKAVEAAAAAGLRHLVYTSIVSADVDGMTVGDEHLITERAIAGAFDSYTVLRNNLYAELVLGAVEPAVAGGALVTARPTGRIAWVSREDCARAAAAALLDGFEGARVLDITGPAAPSGDEMAAVIGEVYGVAVKHAPVPAGVLLEGMLAGGLPRPVAELLVGFDRSAEEGLLGRVSGALEALTGAPGRPLRAVLEAARGA